MARKRFMNSSKTLQVFYDETGSKREVVPGGTVVLDEQWGNRFRKFLSVVEAPKARAKDK